MSMRQLTSMALCAYASIWAHEGAAQDLMWEEPSRFEAAGVGLANPLVPDGLDLRDARLVNNYRVDGRYVIGGVLLGIVAGVAWGTVAMRSTDDWMVAPAYVFTVPVCAILGGVAGGVTGWIVDRSRSP